MDKIEHKEIPFPDSGKMWVRYSKELAKSLCDYLTSQGEEWDALELKRYGIIRLPYVMENGLNILQTIRIEMSRYVCETVFVAPYSEEKQTAIEKRFRFIEKLNAKLPNVEFFADRDGGVVLFVTTYETEEELTSAKLAEFLNYPKLIITKYGPLF